MSAERYQHLSPSSTVSAVRGGGVASPAFHSVALPVGGAGRGAPSLEELNDKIVNLTRLLDLSQTMQEERYGELRRENDDLRRRVASLEKLNGEWVKKWALVIQQLEEQEKKWMQFTAKSLQQWEEKAMPEWEARWHHKVAETEAKEAARRWEAMKEGLDHQLQSHMKATAEVLDAQKAGVTASSESAVKEIDATRVWARRNMERLKHRLRHLEHDVAVFTQQTAAEQQQHQQPCGAEKKCRQLKAMLLKKTGEVEMMTQAMDKELSHVRLLAEEQY